MKNGTKQQPPVSCGIYLTVTPNGKICYESKKDGGIMDYSNQLNLVTSDATSKLFQGKSYWGDTQFVLANDWSVLNVHDSEGNVYVFKPSSSTQPVSTYYAVNDLHKKKDSGVSGSAPTVIYNPSPTPGNPTVIAPEPKRQPRKVQCRNCKGTGIAWIETKYPPEYTSDVITIVNCPDCNLTSNHYHIKHRCTICQNGYVTEY